MEDGIEKDLKQCSVAELREKLKERGQPSGGSRSDLINRLLGQEVELEEGVEGGQTFVGYQVVILCWVVVDSDPEFKAEIFHEAVVSTGTDQKSFRFQPKHQLFPALSLTGLQGFYDGLVLPDLSLEQHGFRFYPLR